MTREKLMRTGFLLCTILGTVFTASACLGGAAGTTDDDDVADDDTAMPDDDTGDDDADVPIISGWLSQEYDMGTEYENAGLWDCSVQWSIDDTGGSAPAGCTDCWVTFLVDFEYQGDTDCNEDAFGKSLGDVPDIGLGIGFVGDDYTAFEYYDGSWITMVEDGTGSVTAGAASGEFVGTSSWKPETGYEVRVTLNASW